ncbi:MAG: hypothetical protein Q8J64_00365 [Thermodesulfovibrionales bacterium]|nr:hypothetical protein [Thermodesulfovibrionales bacterium]
MPPLSSIDIGSNSVRLLIGTVESGRINDIRHERIITRLASGLGASGLLGRPNMQKTLQALKGFLKITGQYGVRHIKAVGTSALREAKNSAEFVENVSAATGIKIEVISGRREAELTAKGVLRGCAPGHNSLHLIIDIGGGSTEWIYSKGRKVIAAGTVPVGVVKLHEKHMRSDPPSTADISSLDRDLDGASAEIKENVGDLFGEGVVLIGTAGTATTLAAIDLSLAVYDRQKVHMHKMSLRRLRALSETLTGLPLEARAGVRGLEPGRADLIIPGIHFTIKLMEKLGIKGIVISDHGLLEGALLELSEEVRD